MTQLRSPNLRAGFRGRLRRAVSRQPLVAFVALAYLLSWSWWVPLALTGETVRTGAGWPTHLPGLLGPAIAAMIVTALAEGRAGLRSLARRTIRWRAGAWWWSVPILLGAAALALLAVGGPWNGRALTGYPGAPAGWGVLATLAIVLVVNGVGEELGWRGFAADRLLERRSLLATALIVAAVWAPWHLPLFFLTATFKAFALPDILGWAVGLTAGSIVLAWLYRGGGRSVLLVAVWHTAFNLTSATPAASGAVAAISSTLVMAAAVAIVLAELLRRPRRPGRTVRDAGPQQPAG